MKSKPTATLITIGSRVKILSIDPSLINSLPSDELECILQMVGETYEVQEVVDQKFFYVEHDWQLPEGYTYHARICLMREDIELVSSI